MSKMTITEYATLTGVKRDTIHKQLKRGVKLAGVNKIERIGNVNILHVSKEKVK